MATNVTFDGVNMRILVTLAPDVNDRVAIDFNNDVYSGAKDDWLADATLNKFRFPIIPIGGDIVSKGKLGTTYIIRDPWQMVAYVGADHTLEVEGNVFTELGGPVFDTSYTAGYTVNIEMEVSTLVEVVETAVSGLTPAESATLATIFQLMLAGKSTPDGQMILTLPNGDTYTISAFEDPSGTVPHDGGAIRHHPAFSTTPDP